MKKGSSEKGFGLVETLVGVAIFILVAVSVYGGYVNLLSGIQVLKVKNTGIALLNEQIEIIRNLPYSKVGIIDGLPNGVIPRNQTLIKDSFSFEVNTTIRDIDDPYDGTISGEPTDYSPADYKLVEIKAQCKDCVYSEEIKIYARVSPYALETTGDNGALFVKVYDANGNPLSGADVNIFAEIGTTTIDIDEITDNNGLFQIVNAPTGTEAYQISVSKNGYSTDKTYAIGDPDNPAPYKPHANVSTGQVTQISFAIDKLSELNVRTLRNDCSTIGNVPFLMTGYKTIGYEENKYQKNHTTNGSGFLNLPSLEWDNFSFDLSDSNYNLAGANTVLPLSLNPDTLQNLDLILVPKNSKALLIQVVDGETGLPLSDAEVILRDSSSNEQTLITGKGFVNQTDWSLGQGVDFESGDGNIEYNNPSGDLKLVSFGENYAFSGELISNTFDLGTSTNFGIFNWAPIAQPQEVGENSIRFQIATNLEINATTTWDFVGPDGNENSYYTNSGMAIYSIHDGDRYLKYKLDLSTASTTFSPLISNISFTYGIECAPLGQVLFDDLDEDFYEVEIKREGYQDYNIQNITLDADWQMLSVTMSP